MARWNKFMCVYECIKCGHKSTHDYRVYDGHACAVCGGYLTRRPAAKNEHIGIDISQRNDITVNGNGHDPV